MGTKNTVYISTGTNYYLSGGGSGQTAYSGSGTPWTSESTTPYELSLNEYTPVWVPQASAAQTIFSGGPPFAHGRRLLYQTYDNVTEQVGVQMRGTTKDNAVALLIQLRQILNRVSFSTPCILAVQGGTNTGYAEIFSADVQETTDYIKEPDGVIRATITWTRSPFFGPSSLTTLINGTSFTNDSASNTASMGALTGEMLYRGGPLNIKIAEQSTFTGINFYVASIHSSIKTSPAEAKTTSSTTGIGYTTTSNLNIGTVLTNDALRIRLLARFTTLTNPSKMQFRATLKTPNGGASWKSSWIGPNASWSSMYLDFGSFPTDAWRNPIASVALASVAYEIRSTDGTSVTATLAYHDLLLYWDFARYVAGASVGGTTKVQQIVGARKAANGGWLPILLPLGYMALASDDSLLDPGVVRGTAPRAFSGALLWMIWTTADDNQTTSATANVTCNHAPLWFSIRGAL